MKALILFVLVGFSLIGGSVADEERKLEIERKSHTVPLAKLDPGLPAGSIKIGKDLYRSIYRIPPDFCEKPEDDGTTTTVSPVEVFERFGIVFGEGASAVYHAENSLLTVTNNAENMEMVEILIGGGCFFDSRHINVRTEIYELPVLQVLQLLESAEAEGDHTPEREAVLKAVRAGSAKLVGVHSLVSLPGQRAKIEDVDEAQIPAEIYPGDPEKGEGPVGVLLDVRKFGTILEAEANLDRHDDISLSISLEHHTAPPEMKVVTGEAKAPQFFVKSITTSVMVHAGQFLILGTWKPTGKPEYAGRGLMHVVFLHASIQVPGGFGKQAE